MSAPKRNGYMAHPDTIIKINYQTNSNTHVQYDLELICILEGRYRVTSEGKIYELHEGDIFLAFPFVDHAYECIDGEKPLGIIIIISPDNIEKFSSLFVNHRPNCPVIPHERLLPGYTEQLRRIVEISMASGKFTANHQNDIICDPRYSKTNISRDIILTHLSASLGELTSYMDLHPLEKQTSQYIDKIIAYINTNISNPELSKNAVCNALGISQAQLTRLLSSTLNVSFVDILHQRRINEAFKLLRKNKFSITEIAFMCGFSSLRSFNRVFLEFTGKTPKEYRQSLYYN